MAMMIGDHGVLIANRSAQALFTEAVGPVNGRSVLDVLPESSEFYARVLKDVLGGLTLTYREQPIRLIIDGRSQTRWFNLDFVPIVGSDGTNIAVLGIACDVSSLMRRIRDVSDSEQRLRLALEGSGMVGVWALDIATGLSIADENVARAYGIAPTACKEGIDDERFLEAIHRDDRQRVRTVLSAAIETGEPYRCRYRVVTGPAGHIRWVITSAKPIFNDSGKVFRLLGVVVDVTDQMETASALAESRFHFQTLTEALPQIVWSCDAEGRHDYFSARWSEFTGIDPQDITEDTWKALVHPDHAEMVAKVWDHARRTGETYDIDYRFRHHSGEYRWLRVMALPVRDGQGRLVRWFGTSTDIHETYLAAEERERLSRELERIATEDALTGVLTRRAFVEKAAKLIDGDPLSGRRSSLLMLDIDRFKSINDAYGHPVGDRVLTESARRIRTSVRERDIVGRIGGEEFAVFLPRCSRRQAIEAAERIRRSMERDPISIDEAHAIVATVSIGVTTSPEPGMTLERLLIVADKALYDAKAEGRNRAVFADPC